MVGRVPRIRVSSVMWPLSSSGTLKSARMMTRLPLRGRSSMVTLFRCMRSGPVYSAAGGHVFDEVPNPTRVAPLIVVPGNDLHHALVEPRGQRGIHDGRVGIPVHVHRYHRILGILQDALEGTLGSCAEGGVDIGGRGIALQ